jgi:hypothetical protein
MQGERVRGDESSSWRRSSTPLEAIIEEMEATRAWIRDATWKRLDRVTVETLVGGKV